MKKMMLLALATACAALFALPAVASAGTWHIEPNSGGFPLKFSVHGGAGKLIGSSTIECSTVTGSGSYENSTTGTVDLTFHGCKGPFGVSCTSSGQPSGTITTPGLKLHNIQLESNNTTPGVLITPPSINNVPAAGEGPFASFSCFGITTQVNGNGIIGQITSPACGSTNQTSGTLVFAGSGGSQQWKQITTSGTSYELTSRSGSGEWGPAVEEATGNITFERPGTVNCTHP